MSIWKESPKKTATGNEGSLRAVNLEDMNLSVRSFNSLKRAGCSTVGDILDEMGEEGDGLRRIRNLGVRSENEIKEKLEELKDEYAHQRPTAQGNSRTYPESRGGLAGYRKRFLASVEVQDPDEELREQEGATDDETEEMAELTSPRIILRPARVLWDMEIGAFHLSGYAEEKLRQCGISNVRDLYATHPKNEPGWYAVRELFRKIAEL